MIADTACFSFLFPFSTFPFASPFLFLYISLFISLYLPFYFLVSPFCIPTP